MTIDKIIVKPSVATLFKELNITTLEQLCEMTPYDLSRYRGLGKYTIMQIEIQLNRFGMSLKSPNLNIKNESTINRIQSIEAHVRKIEGKIDMIIKHLGI